VRGPGLLCTGQSDQQIAMVGPGLGRQGGGLDLSTTRSPRPTRSIVQRTRFVVERGEQAASLTNIERGTGRWSHRCRAAPPATTTIAKSVDFPLVASSEFMSVEGRDEARESTDAERDRVA